MSDLTRRIVDACRRNRGGGAVAAFEEERRSRLLAKAEVDAAVLRVRDQIDRGLGR